MEAQLAVQLAVQLGSSEYKGISGVYSANTGALQLVSALRPVYISATQDIIMSKQVFSLHSVEDLR